MQNTKIKIYITAKHYIYSIKNILKIIVPIFKFNSLLYKNFKFFMINETSNFSTCDIFYLWQQVSALLKNTSLT